MRSRLLLIGTPALLLAASCNSGSDTLDDPSVVQSVERGDLAISVRERAEVQAAKDARVASQLEGRATLIYLIAEGSVVEQGDRVAELDASQIEETRASQAISVAKADAALQQARKNLEILEKELQATAATAESRLQIAKMRTEKFLGEKAPTKAAGGGEVAGTNRELITKLTDLVGEQETGDPSVEIKATALVDRVVKLLESEGSLDFSMGEMANQVLQSIDEVSLATADLQMADDTLLHSRKLFAKGFITKNELVKDEINRRRQLSKVTVAWNNLQLLIKYSLPETLITLKQEAENSRLGLESVEGANEGRRVREAAELDASTAEFNLAKERLDNWNEQIANAVLRAPGPGIVVYGRYDWDEPVYEGMEIREGQEVIILPDISTMVAEIKVHEAQIDKIAVGQRATVKVDAFPERAFTGKVSYVATLPDPSQRNRDLKVFRVKVLLDEDNQEGSLRPGMNATVTVDVGTIRDVLLLPLPAVDSRGDTQFVWRVTPEGPVATPLELGGNNLSYVEVRSGLRPGDRIYMVRPAGARLPPGLAEPTNPQQDADTPQPDANASADVKTNGQSGSR